MGGGYERNPESIKYVPAVRSSVASDQATGPLLLCELPPGWVVSRVHLDPSSIRQADALPSTQGDHDMTDIPPRRSRQPNSYTMPNTTVPDIAEDDSYYEARPRRTSARRYQQPRTTAQRDTEGGPLVAQGSAIQRVDAYGRPVVRQGNRDYVIVPAQEAKRRLHWSVKVGGCLLVMLLGWVLLSAFGTWWTDWRNYTDYGYPRTYQVDAVVGHGDSAAQPSHFIFLNLRGTVTVVEFPGGNQAKTIVYKGMTLLGVNPSYIPVTGRFYDANGDGRPDMEIDYDGTSQIWLNNGVKFVPPGS